MQYEVIKLSRSKKNKATLKFINQYPQYTPRNMHSICALMYFIVFTTGKFYPYASGVFTGSTYGKLMVVAASMK